MTDSPIERAKQLQKRWDAEWREYASRPSFKHLDGDDLIRVAETKKRLTGEEFEALEEAFVERFGISLVAPRGQSGERVAVEVDDELKLPKNDAALSAKQVCEMINVSLSTLNRMVDEGRFPKPFHASKRRRAWLVDDVRAYREAMR